MSEPVTRQQAGALLEAARMQRGLDIGALAAQLKVPTARLEALEAGHWDQLPSGPYARGLATAVCRALHLDPEGVLASMPGAQGPALDRVAQGINQPFRDDERRTALRNPGLWIGLALIAAAMAALLWWPAGPWAWLQTALPTEVVPAVTDEARLPSLETTPARPPEAVASQPVNQADAAKPSKVSAASVAVVPLVEASATASAPSLPAPTATPTPSTMAAGTAVLRIAATSDSWVSVTDARGQSLASRLLSAGESLELTPQTPFRLTLGNAPGVSLMWRGQNQDLSAYAQTRVARLELQ